MTSFTFSLEQLKAAPPEVRRWVEHEIGAALGALSRFDHDTSQVHSAALAACTPEEAMQVFEAIKDNFLLSQVFFELARETPAGRAAPRRRCMRSTSPNCCATHVFPTVIGLPTALQRSTKSFRPSEMTRRRRYSVSTNTAMFTFTNPPTTACAGRGSNCSSRISSRPASRLRSARRCRILARAKISPATRRRTLAREIPVSKFRGVRRL